MTHIPTAAAILAALPADAALRTSTQNIQDVLDAIHAHPKLDPDRDPILDLVSTVHETPNGSEKLSVYLERRAAIADNAEHAVVVDRRDLHDQLRAAWRDGANSDSVMNSADSWSRATNYANAAITGWTTLRRAEDDAVHFGGIDPLHITAGATHPMIPASWRFGFYTTDNGMRFGLLDDGPLVAWDAVVDGLEKGTTWFSTLAKCARLLDLADDVPIPSGVLAAVEHMVATLQAVRADESYRHLSADTVELVESMPTDPLTLALGHGRVTVGQGHHGPDRLPAILFGRNGTGTVGESDPGNRFMHPTECIAAITFTSHESLDIVVEKLAELRARCWPDAPPPFGDEFLAQRLARVASLVGVAVPEGDASFIAGVAGVTLGEIARKLESGDRAARECLEDVVSHHGDFHTACVTTRDLQQHAGDRDSASYWDKQIGVLARMKVQAEAALAGNERTDMNTNTPAGSATGTDLDLDKLPLLPSFGIDVFRIQGFKPEQMQEYARKAIAEAAARRAPQPGVDEAALHDRIKVLENLLKVAEAEIAAMDRGRAAITRRTPPAHGGAQ